MMVLVVASSLISLNAIYLIFRCLRSADEMIDICMRRPHCHHRGFSLLTRAVIGRGCEVQSRGRLSDANSSLVLSAVGGCACAFLCGLRFFNQLPSSSRKGARVACIRVHCILTTDGLLSQMSHEIKLSSTKRPPSTAMLLSTTFYYYFPLLLLSTTTTSTRTTHNITIRNERNRVNVRSRMKRYLLSSLLRLFVLQNHDDKSCRGRAAKSTGAEHEHN